MWRPSNVAVDDGQPIVAARGVDLRFAQAWRGILCRVDEETVIWARAFRKLYGTKSRTNEPDVEEEENEEDSEPYTEADEDETERVGLSIVKFAPIASGACVPLGIRRVRHSTCLVPTQPQRPHAALRSASLRSLAGSAPLLKACAALAPIPATSVL
jgi:hypothetical protein